MKHLIIHAVGNKRDYGLLHGANGTQYFLLYFQLKAGKARWTHAFFLSALLAKTS